MAKVILIDKGINLHTSTFTFSRYTASFLRERIRRNRRVLCNLQIHSANSTIFITENMFWMIRIYQFQIYNFDACLFNNQILDIVGENNGLYSDT